MIKTESLNSLAYFREKPLGMCYVGDPHNTYVMHGCGLSGDLQAIRFIVRSKSVPLNTLYTCTYVICIYGYSNF